MSISIQSADRQAAPRPAELTVVRPPVAAEKLPAAAVQDSQFAKAADPKEIREELREAIARLNEQMQKQGRNLSFSMDERVNRTVITVKDTHSGEVVRQIPDETLLKVAHSIEDFKGLLHNEFI